MVDENDIYKLIRDRCVFDDSARVAARDVLKFIKNRILTKRVGMNRAEVYENEIYELIKGRCVFEYSARKASRDILRLIKDRIRILTKKVGVNRAEVDESGDMKDKIHAYRFCPFCGGEIERC